LRELDFIKIISLAQDFNLIAWIDAVCRSKDGDLSSGTMKECK